VFRRLLDFSIAAPFVSSAQVARLALETWASFNLYCLDCESDALDRLPNNTPVADFKCYVCDRSYQLKAQDGRFGVRIPGVAINPRFDYIRRGEMPEHILVEFDKQLNTVVFVDAIPGRLIPEDRVVPQKPLSQTARRAGWQGCSIVISALGADGRAGRDRENRSALSDGDPSDQRGRSANHRYRRADEKARLSQHLHAAPIP
jgi:type II restriction enzyme